MSRYESFVWGSPITLTSAVLCCIERDREFNLIFFTTDVVICTLDVSYGFLSYMQQISAGAL